MGTAVRAQRVLELLLSAGLTPLQRISGQSIDDCSSKTAVQLLLEQVQQLHQLKSRLSLQHQQMLSLSPPLRRHAGGPPDPVLSGVPDTQSYSALLALLAQLPPSQLASLEHQLKTSQTTNSLEKTSALHQSPPMTPATAQAKWSGALSRLESHWQLKVTPPLGKGGPCSFSLEEEQDPSATTVSTTSSDECGASIKLYFGPKFLSVRKSDFFAEVKST